MNSVCSLGDRRYRWIALQKGGVQEVFVSVCSLSNDHVDVTVIGIMLLKASKLSARCQTSAGSTCNVENDGKRTSDGTVLLIVRGATHTTQQIER